MNKTFTKLLSMLLILCMAAGLAACGEDKAPQEAPAEEAPAEEAPAEEAPAEEAPAEEEELVIGGTVIPTEEEAMAIMGLDKVPEKVLCATYNTCIICHTLGVELSGRVDTRRPLPPELNDVPTIGTVTGGTSLDMEKIVSLAGDMVISDTFYEENLRPALEEQNIKCYFVDTADFEGLKDTIALMGAAFGRREQAIELLQGWADDIAAMQEAIKDKESPVVLMIRNGDLMATKNSYAGGLMEILNITNITDLMGFEDDVPGFVPLDIEKILEINPDYIIIPGGEEREMCIEAMNNILTGSEWATLDAVKEGRVFAPSDTNFMPLADMGCIDALHELFDILYK